MSTDLLDQKTHKGSLQITRYGGGVAFGCCLQIMAICDDGLGYHTPGRGHACVTVAEAEHLVTVLKQFIEYAKPTVPTSDDLFNSCVMYGADRAAVAGWPDFKRCEFIVDYLSGA